MAPVRGILLILCAVSLFTLMQAFIKAASVRVPAGQAVFFRAFLSLPLIALWLWWRRDLRAGLQTDNWRAHAVRGIAGTCAMGMGFAGLAYLPLAEATAIRFVTPVMLVIFAALILGETFRVIRILAVILGLFGVTIIVWPRLGQDSLGAGALLGVGLTLASATLAALAQTFIKAMSGTERVEAIVFYFSATASVLSLLTLPFGWVVPDAREWALLIGAGLIGALGQVLLTSSYRHADAGALAPFTYVSMLWAILVGYLWFSEIPTVQTLAGAVLVIAAGIIIVLRERRLAKDAIARRKLRSKGMM
ncbi:DMT family transporter [Palleronia sp. LCG004]|uniref:DMT family transporter n=1 Tax=Palleronia sp. LCG004 TaxID=3079304 RepID=UPI002941D1C6|nr:DMT family transporter [Palleronia sp. LCG004]WOI55412.1 DMT family transporter [Palleronia sp. LCG004]